MMQLPSSAVRACREQLDVVLKMVLTDSKNRHAGLALNRYLEAHKPTDPKQRADMKTTPEDLHLENVSQIQVPEVYRNAFTRWRELVKQRSWTTMTAQGASSLAIGLGNESPLEVGLTVHHTYGMPVIAGSAIKGMCRRGALQLKREGKLDENQFTAMFGDTESASAFVFWDAWYDPSSVDGMPFHRDVITVHHQRYYNKGSAWPTDFDDPNPVPFLVVRPGAQFLFAISAPTPVWGEYARELLKWCLENIGIGGKTNAGYGYFQPLHQTGPEEPATVPQLQVTAKEISTPKGAVAAKVVDIDAKPMKVQLIETGEMVACSGVTPQGLGLQPGSVVFVRLERDRKTKKVISSKYAGKP